MVEVVPGETRQSLAHAAFATKPAKPARFSYPTVVSVNVGL